MHSSEGVGFSKKRSFERLDDNPPNAAIDGMEINFSLLDFKPGEHDMKIFEFAKKRNSIACLDSGEGKTWIAVSLINEIANSVQLSGEKRLIIFLAPYVKLVHKQYKVIKDNTKLKVDEYVGAKGVDDWDAESWEKEFNQNEVMVMTPQILLNALRKAFLKIEMICLMVLDECHLTTGNHPYARLMKEFYHNSGEKPKVFGMTGTASPVIKKGMCSANDSKHQILELEAMLDSQIYTTEIMTQGQVSNSRDVVMLESGNLKQRGQMVNIMKSEHCMIDTTLNREGDASVLKPCNSKGMNASKLPQVGALDDQILPLKRQPEENKSTVKSKVSSAGTTKRKELHGTTCIQALSGTWGDMVDNTVFFAYKIDFVCNIPNQQYSSFILLIESNLEDDVANLEIDLYLVQKFVKSSVSSCGQVLLNAEQVRKSKCFQEFFFNGIFGKLFIRSDLEKGRKFLLQTDVPLWDSLNMFLLLPLEFAKNSSQEPWKIDWVGIDSCCSEVEFLKTNAWLSAEQSGNFIRGSQSAGVIESNLNCTGNIHFANGSFPITNIKDMVVVSVHTGRFYSVLEVLPETSAASSFDGHSDEAPSNYSSFIDYFQKKYGISLVRPGQPLLLMKQSHKAHNLLVNFKEGFLSKKKKPNSSKKIDRKPYDLARMPPELLISVNVRLSVLKSMYLLPSVVHRLQSLMLASQLREQIRRDCEDFQISSSLILEALTTMKCNESFSMERLELLGDSVLKYALSCDLFLRYPEKHEGQLSDCRTSAIRNSTLHKFGIDKKIQGYIRDNPFDPRRWTAPGQQSIRLIPCDHGVDTSEVPVNSTFYTEDPKVMVGKCCDKGHRWMGSKTISDCVEALIGACYVGGGLFRSMQFMKWLGMDVELHLSLLDETIKKASLYSYIPKLAEIEILESKLEYQFLVKGLLLEAITHGSDEQEVDSGYCYQRLEFLGDSVLDILVTWYLYQSHKDIDPGELTDLRSASVNNETFAQAAVRRNLHLHLQHSSEHLSNQITEFAQFVSASCSNTNTPQSATCPKALGDLVESIAGAILIDSKLNLDEVWRIFKPLLSPIVTPDKLELPPLRELIELCDSLGLYIKDNCITIGAEFFAEVSVQLKDTLLIGEGFGQTRKAAKAQAAVHLLKDLEDRGISRRNQSEDPAVASSSADLAIRSCNQSCPEALCKFPSPKKRKTCDSQTPQAPSAYGGSKHNLLAIDPIDTKKGGPRTTLFDVCKRQQWPRPIFETTEEKSRSPIEFNEGPEKRQGFNSFVSQITLTIPDHTDVVLSGHPQADKKSSYDSACLAMLYELEQLGILTIGK